MEQLKDDPYYIIDDNLKASEDVDVDFYTSGPFR